LLPRDAAPLLVHLDDDARYRLCMPADVLDVLIGHRFRVIAEQFPTARNRDPFGLLVCTIRYVHGAPPERESQRFVLAGWRALARRCVIDAPMSV